jgi:large subunit ribosomal protein L23
VAEVPLLEVLRRPIITEKSTALAGEGKYVFEVHPDANKLQIKEAVERAFNVEVAAVNTCWVKGKFRRVGRNRGRTSPWKKAVVTLKPGYRIDLFEGV